MGFKDRMKKAAESAQAATSKIGVGASGEQIEQANLAQKLVQQGVDTPAHIDSMTATGNTDATGSTEYEFKLTVSPAGGEAYAAAARQYIHPSATFSEGMDVSVKVHPDDSSRMMIFGAS